jgi:hypothetical protein
MNIIGLIGAKQSGKTTTVKYIKQFYGSKNVNEIMLAGKLKKVCSKVFHTPPQCFEDQGLKEVPYEVPIRLDSEMVELIFLEYGVAGHLSVDSLPLLRTPRMVLQIVGTEILRSVDDKIHCKAAEECLNADQINVISDIRFVNEFDYFSKLPNCKFTPLFIDRSKILKNSDTHSSELDIPRLKCRSIWIDNNGALKALRARVVDSLNIHVSLDIYPK